MVIFLIIVKNISTTTKVYLCIITEYLLSLINLSFIKLNTFFRYAFYTVGLILLNQKNITMSYLH